MQPIVAHCPNPACARAFRVKARYAGGRGRCPACRSWMYVPRPPAAPPPSTFGWAATLCLLLGVAGLAAVAATPWLPGHAAAAAGALGEPGGIGPDARPFVVGVPLGLAALPLGALMLGAAYRRPTALARLLTYAAAWLTSAVALIAVQHLHDEAGYLAALEAASPRLGAYLFAGVGGAAGAAAMFVLAAFALHRRWWSRALGTLALGLPLALGVVWICRGELGL